MLCGGVKKTFQFDFSMKSERAGEQEKARNFKVHKFMRKILFFSVINYIFLSWVSQSVVHKWCCQPWNNFTPPTERQTSSAKNLKFWIFFITKHIWNFHIFCMKRNDIVGRRALSIHASKSSAELSSLFSAKTLRKECCDGEYIIIYFSLSFTSRRKGKCAFEFAFEST